MTVTRNMVMVSETYKVRDRYDGEWIYEERSTEKQQGWKVRLYEVDQSILAELFDKAAEQFIEEHRRIKEFFTSLNKGKWMATTMWSYEGPTNVRVMPDIQDTNLILVAEQVIEDYDESLIDDMFFYEREGMSTTISFGGWQAIFNLPIKSNRKEGPTVRTYSASIEPSGCSSEEVDYYIDLFELILDGEDQEGDGGGGTIGDLLKDLL